MHRGLLLFSREKKSGEKHLNYYLSMSEHLLCMATGEGISSLKLTDMFVHHTGYFCAPIHPLLSCSFTFQCPHSLSRELFHIQPQATFTHKLLSKIKPFSFLPRFAVFAVKLAVFIHIKKTKRLLSSSNRVKTLSSMKSISG